MLFFLVVFFVSANCKESQNRLEAEDENSATSFFPRTMSGFEALPIFAHEVALVPPAACFRGTDARGLPGSGNALALSLGALCESRAPHGKQPTTSPMWTINPLSQKMLLPFAAPAPAPAPAPPPPLSRSTLSASGTTVASHGRRRHVDHGALRYKSAARNVKDALQDLTKFNANHHREVFAAPRPTSPNKSYGVTRHYFDDEAVPLHGHAGDAEWPTLKYDDGTFSPLMMPAMARPVPCALRAQHRRHHQQPSSSSSPASSVMPPAPFPFLVNGGAVLERAEDGQFHLVSGNTARGVATSHEDEKRAAAIATGDACAPPPAPSARGRAFTNDKNQITGRAVFKVQVPRDGHFTAQPELCPVDASASRPPRGTDLLVVSKDTCSYRQQAVYRVGDAGRN